MTNTQVQQLSKQVSYKEKAPKILTTILVVISSLALSLAAESCFADSAAASSTSSSNNTTAIVTTAAIGALGVTAVIAGLLNNNDDDNDVVPEEQRTPRDEDYFSNLEYKPNSQLGSNPGGIFFDKNSDREYYVKFYLNEMHSRSEFLAATVYAMFGVNVPKAYLETMKNPWSGKEQLVYISKWKDNLEVICKKHVDCTKRTTDASEQLAKIHLISVLVKNTDINPSNVLFKKNNIFVIDAGGSFKFGASESQEYSPELSDFCRLVDGGNTTKIFGSPFKEYTMKNTDYLINWLNSCWDENEIKAAIKASGIDDGDMIFVNLKLRFENLKTVLQELKDGGTICQ